MSESRWAGRVTGLGVLASFIAVAMIVIAGPGHRFGLIPVKFAVYGSAAAGLIGVFAVLAILVGVLGRGVRPGAWPRTLIAFVLAGGIAVQIVRWVMIGSSVPAIHDITTDTQDPPAFDALLGARSSAINPPDYAGGDVAAQQREAYPDIAPIALPGVSPAQALSIAEQAARSIGLDAVVAQPDDMIVEATDTTFWYGYKDDVVMRVRPTAVGSVIDIRSKSRVGQSDLGTNAARIRALSARIRTLAGN